MTHRKNDMNSPQMLSVFDSSTDCKMLHASQVENESAVILLRSRITAITYRLGYSELKRENMLLVVSEMVSNQLKHAGGHGLIQLWQQPGALLDIVALDYGAGIANLENAEKDGYSTAHTLGKGLGSIRRLSDESYIYTQTTKPGVAKKWTGALFLARFRLDKPGIDSSVEVKPEIGFFSRSLSDDRFNGDRIYMHREKDRLRWLHLDGLGHGEEAQHATSHLAAHLAHCETHAELLAAIDRQLRNTRGAVAIAAELNMKDRLLNVIGVGDMHAHIIDGREMQNLSFAPGILGKEHKIPVPYKLNFGKRCLVMTCSDGIRRNWDESNFTGLFQHAPQLIAYVLGNVMGRISDDQSFCIVKIDS